MSNKFLSFCCSFALSASASLAAPRVGRAQGEEDKVYRVAEVDEKAVIDRRSQTANQPEGYRCSNNEGRVRLRVVLRKSGEVTDAAVVKPSGCVDFDESALRAVRRVAFKAAKKGGQLVSQSALFEYNYRTTVNVTRGRSPR